MYVYIYINIFIYIYTYLYTRISWRYAPFIEGPGGPGRRIMNSKRSRQTFVGNGSQNSL